MNDWQSTIADLTRQQNAYVLITIARTKGSAPREAGTKMLVTCTSRKGTIGGGRLEHDAISLARDLLLGDTSSGSIRKRYILGPEQDQCCGGVVHLLFERLDEGKLSWITSLEQQLSRHTAAVLVTQLGPSHHSQDTLMTTHRMLVTENEVCGRLSSDEQCSSYVRQSREMLSSRGKPQTELFTPTLINTDLDAAASNEEGTVLLEPVLPSDFHIALFGAGHVGQALVSILSNLPCRITWIDSRAEAYPAVIPDNVRQLVSENPATLVDGIPAGSFILVMTHSHMLDRAICERSLRRDDLAYCGLIGSSSKRRQFEKRFQASGLPSSALNRLTCPIGVSGITEKHPAAIAIAVSAEILQLRERLQVDQAATQNIADLSDIANPLVACHSQYESTPALDLELTQ